MQAKSKMFIAFTVFVLQPLHLPFACCMSDCNACGRYLLSMKSYTLLYLWSHDFQREQILVVLMEI